MAAGRGSRRRRIAFRGRLGARVAIALIAVPLLLVKALAETAVTAPTWCSAVDPHRPQAGTSVSFVMVVMFWTLPPTSDKPDNSILLAPRHSGRQHHSLGRPEVGH